MQLLLTPIGYQPNQPRGENETLTLVPRFTNPKLSFLERTSDVMGPVSLILEEGWNEVSDWKREKEKKSAPYMSSSPPLSENMYRDSWQTKVTLVPLEFTAMSKILLVAQVRTTLPSRS